MQVADKFFFHALDDICYFTNVFFPCRTLGRASSEMRLYYCIPSAKTLSQSSQRHTNQNGQVEGEFNVRASYLCGQDICGDAILASLGYTWRSIDLFHEVVSLRTYYRYSSWLPFGLCQPNSDKVNLYLHI